MPLSQAKMTKVVLLVGVLTWFQYSATSGNPVDSQMYTKLSTSFWKHEPPKPTDELRNLLPMRGSYPRARETLRGRERGKRVEHRISLR